MPGGATGERHRTPGSSDHPRGPRAAGLAAARRPSCNLAIGGGRGGGVGTHLRPSVRYGCLTLEGYDSKGGPLPAWGRTVQACSCPADWTARRSASDCRARGDFIPWRARLRSIAASARLCPRRCGDCVGRWAGPNRHRESTCRVRARAADAA
ncbi:hypothetical protein BV25DRAFT_993891 [Artomyces pyxidatus]|uniref:Uncharacterized protein n=1 Tax=Artomyces pyxidatus TaxID=48021 RepID=A0ACB8SUQ6_9AGAM|nr:hypothetical protein BV25DRAFT_993891 [Artomyces pyxidatus]